jgi:hypothetical protein
MKTWEDFTDIWVTDYEFYGKDSDPLPIPVCYVSKNLITGELIRHWISENETTPEYSLNDTSLFVAFFSPAELKCHLALNFNFPIYTLDLFPEFRNLTNGLRLPSGNSLIGACLYYGLSPSDATYKEAMRNRILQGPPYSEKEQNQILDYCQKDVDMTTDLFNVMKPHINLPYALLRGKYMGTVAQMERNGIPIDLPSLKRLKDNWEIVKSKLIQEVDKEYGVYERTTFKIALFKKFLEKHRIPWEYTTTGMPRTDEKFFKEQAKMYPILRNLAEARYTLGQLKLNSIEIGNDGRHRSPLHPFRSKTSRNQPSSAKYIFGPSVWIRCLIKPQKGMAIAYCDYEQQELGIAAALSGDANLKEAYETGDPYLKFGKSFGMIPPGGTKETYPEERDVCKRLMLALNYGMSAEGFALRTGIPLIQAKMMVKAHKQQFYKYWKWNSNFVDMGIMSGRVKTNFNWQFYTTGVQHINSLKNWGMQSNGGDILRLAISMCFDDGIRVIAPVHDALLIEAPALDIENAVKNAKKCMENASEYVIGYKIRVDAKIIRYPDHYADPRGSPMWDTIWKIIGSVTPGERTRFSMDSIRKDLALDFWEVTKEKKGKTKMKLENLTEKNLAKKLRKKSKLSHFEIMNLIQEGRDTDYDLEHEIDWENESYNTAMDKLLGDINPTKKKTLRELSGEEM